MKSSPTINFRIAIFLAVAMAIMVGVSLHRIRIDTDVVASLPRHNPVINDALFFFKNSPIQDQIVIDVSLNPLDPAELATCMGTINQELEASGLFKEVGMEKSRDQFPGLIISIVHNLPYLFSPSDLEKQVAPLLAPERIQKRVVEQYTQLLNLDGIGQAGFMAQDPLGLKEIIAAKLAQLAPTTNIQIYQGQLLSRDGRHGLVIAKPKSSATDTTFSRQAIHLIEAIRTQLNREYAHRGIQVTLTPVGAYRAAYDNEQIVRKDVQKAILWATLGIALLLLLVFPRPYIGLLAFLPAIFGSVAALFVYSLLYQKISIMVLGFSGAIISITVDHGVAYLLFLDQPRETRGKDASREVWAVGLAATLTTIGAFAVLGISNFPILEQLGKFTALGILFSFLFIHSFFPRLFPVLPAGKPRTLLLRRGVDKLRFKGKTGALVALGFALLMLFFAKPEFNTALNRMNTVSQATQAAENMFTEVWGDIFSDKSYLMIQGPSVAEIQLKSDALLERMDPDVASGVVRSGFLPSMIFPGSTIKARNFQAWNNFWTGERVRHLRQTLEQKADALGFAPDAFAPFFQKVTQDQCPPGPLTIPENDYSLLGFSQNKDHTGWVQNSSLVVDGASDFDAFYQRYRPLALIFNAGWFSRHLGHLLFTTFLKMFLIIVATIALLLLLFFFDLQLTMVALLPVIFAFVSTLGTLKLLHHPLDIPGLMLSIVIFGMGIDYSLFFVQSYQRFPDENHPLHQLVRLSVLMASLSTIIGFGVLCLAKHALLRSAGVISLLGIGYSLIGAFLILPPILRHIFQTRQVEAISPKMDLFHRVLRRYRALEAYPRMFARFKMHLDPMFSELPRFLDNGAPMKTIIDIGCGYGVPACWLIERFEREVTVYGIDPDPERVRVCSRAVGRLGIIEQNSAPGMPLVATPADAAMMLDISHYLSDADLQTTLRRIYDTLRQKGKFIIRAVMPPLRSPSWKWRLEAMRQKYNGIPTYYRSPETMEAFLVKAGFKLASIQPSGASKETVWFIATVEKREKVEK